MLTVRPICQVAKPYIDENATDTLLETATRKPMVTAITKEAHRVEGRMMRAIGRSTNFHTGSWV